MATETRIYSVSNGSNDPRLVRATSRAQALRHVASSTFRVDIAGQEEIVAHLTDGGKVEDAALTEPPAPEPQVSATDASIESGDTQ